MQSEVCKNRCVRRVRVEYFCNVQGEDVSNAFVQGAMYNFLSHSRLVRVTLLCDFLPLEFMQFLCQTAWLSVQPLSSPGCKETLLPSPRRAFVVSRQFSFGGLSCACGGRISEPLGESPRFVCVRFLSLHISKLLGRLTLTSTLRQLDSNTLCTDREGFGNIDCFWVVGSMRRERGFFAPKQRET